MHNVEQENKLLIDITNSDLNLFNNEIVANIELKSISSIKSLHNHFPKGYGFLKGIFDLEILSEEVSEQILSFI